MRWEEEEPKASLTPFPCLPLLEKVGEMQSIMFALGGPSDTKVICPTPLLLLVRLLVPKKSGGACKESTVEGEKQSGR